MRVNEAKAASAQWWSLEGLDVELFKQTRERQGLTSALFRLLVGPEE